VFAHFKSPWFFLESEGEYIELFERHGFNAVFCKIEETKSYHTPQEAYRIFESGAIAGYLNPKYYDIEIDERYVRRFKEIVRKSFEEQAGSGVVELVFNRVYLIAVKEGK